MSTRQSWLCLLCTLVLVSSGVIYSQDRSVSTAGKSGQWVDISAKVIQSLAREGKKIGYRDGLEILWALIKYRFKG